MTFKEKVVKILAEVLDDEDKNLLYEAVKTKVGSRLAKELANDYEQKINKYLHLKGEEYVKPLIVATCKEMIALEKYKDNEEWVRKVIREEIKKIQNESD